jgi:DNA-binding transcriptional LysR family regulator
MSISPDKLARLDLNLLVALQVLYEECNVTRAADRLFITQPAMSRTLSRLRDLFDDPLFTRVSRGLIPTPRAEELALDLPELLNTIGRLVTPSEFDPASFEYTFRIAIAEQYGQSLFGPLVAELQTDAPSVILQAIDCSERIEDMLAKGSIDFVIDLEAPEANDIDFLPLLASEPTIIARHNHPLAGKKRLSLKDALKYSYVRCFPVDAIKAVPLFDQMLEELGHRRNCSFHTSNLLTALEVVRNSDALLASPAFILNSQLLNSDFVTFKLPKEFDGMQRIIGLAQHRRTLTSQAHQWLTEKIASITAEHWTVKKVKARGRTR